MQQGILYESMNMAALWKLPVVFCCINNQYGMGTKIDNAVGNKDFSSRAKSFGLETIHINHLDVEKAYLDIQSVIDKTRNNCPSFIEIECYRFFGHARKDKSPYRSEEEEKENRKFDPVNFAKDKLISSKILDEEDLNILHNIIDKEMDHAMKFAIESPLNNDDEIFRDVYDKNYTIESVDSRIKNILSI